MPLCSRTLGPINSDLLFTGIRDVYEFYRIMSGRHYLVVNGGEFKIKLRDLKADFLMASTFIHECIFKARSFNAEPGTRHRLIVYVKFNNFDGVMQEAADEEEFEGNVDGMTDTELIQMATNKMKCAMYFELDHEIASNECTISLNDYKTSDIDIYFKGMGQLFCTNL
jgi:hypothetical protein